MKKSVPLTKIGFLSIMTFASLLAPSVLADSTSNATIKAIAGDQAVSPVNPDIPKDPNGENQHPEEGNSTGQTGPLQINYVSHLNFGNDIKLTEAKVKANLKNQGTPFFQVSDLRGTGAGWSLNVTLGDFTSTDAKQKTTIKGATIALTNGIAKTSNEADSNNQEIDAAVVHDQILLAGSTAAVPLMDAQSGTGRGTWLASYDKDSSKSDNDKIVFEAPTNSIDANSQYTATLTWQLSDAPSPK